MSCLCWSVADIFLIWNYPDLPLKLWYFIFSAYFRYKALCYVFDSNCVGAANNLQVSKTVFFLAEIFMIFRRIFFYSFPSLFFFFAVIGILQLFSLLTASRWRYFFTVGFRWQFLAVFWIWKRALIIIYYFYFFFAASTAFAEFSSCVAAEFSLVFFQFFFMKMLICFLTQISCCILIKN